MVLRQRRASAACAICIVSQSDRIGRAPRATGAMRMIVTPSGRRPPAADRLGRPVDDKFSPLLRLRASPPTVSSGFVARPRLAERLTEAVGRPVTVMSAGPGYGKTLTLASWSHSQAAPGRLAWLSSDETDNDVRAFWSDVLGSLAIAGVLPKSSTLREVMHASTFGSREAQLVRTALAEIPAIVTLVLDDFHLISDTRVQESVGHLLEHQPPQLRLVLATRFDPALRLNRLRVNGDLTDFRRGNDLAFTRDEAAELLHRNDVHLTEHELGILLDHTAIRTGCREV